jgi:hypothetical protein
MEEGEIEVDSIIPIGLPILLLNWRGNQDFSASLISSTSPITAGAGIFI